MNTIYKDKTEEEKKIIIKKQLEYYYNNKEKINETRKNKRDITKVTKVRGTEIKKLIYKDKSEEDKQKHRENM